MAPRYKLVFRKRICSFSIRGTPACPSAGGTARRWWWWDMTRAFVEDEYPLACEKTGPARAPSRSAACSRRPATRRSPCSTRAGIVADKQIIRGRWKSRYDNPLLKSPKAHEIVEEVAPLPDEVVVRKTKPSGFFGTELKRLPDFTTTRDTLIVTGMVTSGCVARDSRGTPSRSTTGSSSPSRASRTAPSSPMTSPSWT